MIKRRKMLELLSLAPFTIPQAISPLAGKHINKVCNTPTKDAWDPARCNPNEVRDQVWRIVRKNKKQEGALLRMRMKLLQAQSPEGIQQVIAQELRNLLRNK